MQLLITIKQHIFETKEKFLFFITVGVSLHAVLYFYLQNSILVNYDAFARLNIARKVIDNLTPGISQLGGLWLPLPQLMFVPFIWSDFLWHTGLAGAIISSISFIFGSVYLAKTAYLITKDLKASCIVLLIFVTNQNILLMQSSPMSESFFLLCLIMVTYFLTQWVQTASTGHLLASAFWVMIGTLTRYEGYFVLIGACLTVFSVLLFQHWQKKRVAHIEGTMVLFLTIAGYGIFLWCVYCMIFFKDPFIWLHFYTNVKEAKAVAHIVDLDRKTWLASFSTYFQVSLWMNGFINSALGIAGFIVLIRMLVKKIIKKEHITLYLPVFIIGTSLFMSLIYAYEKGLIPGIMFRPITIEHMFNKSINTYFHYNSPNIRYGLTITPFIALFAGFFVSRKKILFILSSILIMFQLYANFYTPLNLQFSIPKAQQYLYLPVATWMSANYDEGFILISASRHEDTMFQFKIPYKNFIHEGTRNYWKTSLHDPAKFATWVVYNDIIDGDTLAPQLTPQAHDILRRQFKLVYTDAGGFQIYRRI